MPHKCPIAQKVWRNGYMKRRGLSAVLTDIVLDLQGYRLRVY